MMRISPLFTGCAAALITPFLPDGRLDEQALRKLIQRQIAAGMNALVLLGTTGEPCSLSMEERGRVIQIGLDEAKGRLPVIIGTGSNQTPTAIAYAKQAHALGAQGQLCVTPYYNKTTQQGLVQHYTAILESCDLPMLLYSVPSRTGMRIEPETAAQLMTLPGVCGLKEAGSDMALTENILLATGGNLPIYCGNDDMIVPLMALGAVGAISVCANIVPAQTKAITHAMLAGCLAEAKDAQLALLPLIRALFSQVSPIPAKSALHMLGHIHDALRLPLTPLTEPYRSQLRDLLASMGLLPCNPEH
ncbi:MAG: 4-hydroxy-tetrahydrodipicolinate synthase [Clostridia bacterium]|nr:4-hydroxy-tetrahydrodipicolinate synthase [Clostridia bacterium]